MKLNYLFTDILVWNVVNGWIEPYNNGSTLLLKAKSSGKKSLEVKKAGLVKNKDTSKSVNVPGKLELLSFSAFVSLNPIGIHSRYILESLLKNEKDYFVFQRKICISFVFNQVSLWRLEVTK